MKARLLALIVFYLAIGFALGWFVSRVGACI
jgi:hypothetical protein